MVATANPPLTLAQISTLMDGECPDCGGTHMLRGPTAIETLHYSHWTCGDCQMGFKIVKLICLREGPHPARAAFHDANEPVRTCTREGCKKPYTGPSLYCCIGCALEDA